MRGLTGSIGDWGYLYEQAFKHIQPGGYLEHLEFGIYTSASPDSNNPADVLYRRLSDLICEAGDKMGKEFRVAERIADRMRRAGTLQLNPFIPISILFPPALSFIVLYITLARSVN